LKVASLPDIELTYIEKGDSDRATVVFVHGSLNDYRSWQLQFDKFMACGYHVVSYSRRNHFPNKWSEYPVNYSIRTERDDLIEFIATIGLKIPVHIVGSSYGAFIAALVGRDHPELVRSLVLGEPPILSMLTENASGGGHATEFEENFADKVLSPLRNGEFEAAAMGFVDSVEGEGTFDRLPLKTREMMRENSRSLVAELPTPERDHFTSDDARKITAPALLVKGQYTSQMYQKIIASLANSMPCATIATIEESSHTPYNTNPEAYNKAVLGFLSDH